MDPYKIELLIRKIYGGGRWDDPFFRLSNADFWGNMDPKMVEIKYNASVLLTLWRLINIHIENNEDANITLTQELRDHSDELQTNLVSNARLLEILIKMETKAIELNL